MNKIKQSDLPNIPEEAWFAYIDHARLIRIFIFTLIFLLFVSIPIWSNKVYYGDDFLRLYTGDASTWTSNGRPLTTALQFFLTFSTIINDISPVPLLIGITFLSFSSALFVSSLRINLPLVQMVLLSLGIVANPFLTQPMLYIWDSISILSAFSLAMLAAMLNSPNQLKNMTGTVLVLLCMLMLYQVSINLYLSCIIISAYCLISRQQPFLRFVLLKAGAIVIAVLIYKIFIATALIADTYSVEQSQLATFDTNFVTTTSIVIMKFVTLLQFAWPGWRILFVLLPALLVFVCVIFNAVKLNRDKTRQHRIAISMVVLFSPLLILLLIPGVSLFLNVPLVAPRTMTAYSAFTLFCMIVAFSISLRWLRTIIIGGFIVSIMYTSVTMVSVFNTLIKEQNYLSSVMWMIKADIARTPAVKNITFINVINIFPDTQYSRAVFPLVTKISPAVSRYTYQYYFMNISTGIPAIKLTGEMLRFKPRSVISQSCDYRLYLFNDTAIVDFNTHCNKRVL